MVRCSERMTMINKIENQLLMRADLNHLRYLFDLTDDFEDGVDEDLCNLYTELVNKRYLAQRGPYRKPDHCVFTSWLVDERKHTARDFLDQFRLSREALWDLVNLIKDDPALQSVPGKMMLPPPEHHLMVLLCSENCQFFYDRIGICDKQFTTCNCSRFEFENDGCYMAGRSRAERNCIRYKKRIWCAKLRQYHGRYLAPIRI